MASEEFRNLYDKFVDAYENNRSIFELPIFPLFAALLTAGWGYLIYYLVVKVELYGLALCVVIAPCILIGMSIACYGAFVAQAERSYYKALFHEFFLKAMNISYVPSSFSKEKFGASVKFSAGSYAIASSVAGFSMAGRLNRRQGALSSMLTEKVRYKVQEIFKILNERFKIVKCKDDLISVTTNLMYKGIEIYDVKIETLKNLFVFGLMIAAATAFVLILVYIAVVVVGNKFMWDELAAEVFLPLAIMLSASFLPFIFLNFSKPVDALVISKQHYTKFKYEEGMEEELKELLGVKNVKICFDKKDFVIYVNEGRDFFGVMNTFYFYREKRVFDFLGKLEVIQDFIDRHEIS